MSSPADSKGGGSGMGMNRAKQSCIVATTGSLDVLSNPLRTIYQCTVCLEEYAAKDVVRVLPACGHAFHAACIDAWLRQHPTCPVCRASLRAAKNQHHRARTLDHGLAATAAASATAPASGSPQVPASSSSPPQARAAGDRTDTGPDARLEIVVTQEPGSSANQQQGAGVADRSGCGETASRSTGS